MKCTFNLRMSINIHHPLLKNTRWYNIQGQFSTVNIDYRLQDGRLRNCSLIPGRGNRFFSYPVSRMGSIQHILPFGWWGSFSEGKEAGVRSRPLTSNYCLGKEMCSYTFTTQYAFMPCKGTTLLIIKRLLYLLKCMTSWCTLHHIPAAHAIR